MLIKTLGSSGGIGRARRERLALHLEVVRGLDSWEGLRGKFVSQRALLKGVSGIQQSKEVFEESDLALIDGKFYSTMITLFEDDVKKVDSSVLSFSLSWS